MDTASMIQRVNGKLLENGVKVEPFNEMPLGPLGDNGLGAVKGVPVRRDFLINPTNGKRSVHLFDVRTKQLLAERPMAISFEEAIDDYRWVATLASLSLQ